LNGAHETPLQRGSVMIRFWMRARIRQLAGIAVRWPWRPQRVGTAGARSPDGRAGLAREVRNPYPSVWYV